MKDSDWVILYELYKNPKITQVASALFMTQPTLSKRLQLIEDEFQVRIVNRSTKGVEFTKEGEYLAKQAREHIYLINTAHYEIEAMKQEGYGIIKIASSYTYCKFQLLQIIAEYRRTHPFIRFEIQNVRSDELIQTIEDGLADVVFIRGDYEGPIKRRLVSRENAYILSKEKILIEDLPVLPQINSMLGGKSKWVIEQWWNRRFSCPPIIGVTVRDVDLCWKMVQLGGSYTLSFISEEQLQEFRFAHICMEDENGIPLERSTWFACAENIRRPQYVDEFIEYVENHVNLNE